MRAGVGGALAALLLLAGAAGGTGREGAVHVFVAPTGSDANACTAGAPCASLDRAYRVAKPGDTVELAGGTYASQTVGVDRTKLSLSPPCTLRAPARCVTFRPAAGATVVVDGDLIMYGSNAVFKGAKNPHAFRVARNVLSEAVPGAATSHDVTFENLDAAAFAIGPNHRITIKGGDWGPNYICGSQGGVIENKIEPSGQILNQWPHDIVLDGLYIHDQNSADLGRCHMGGLFVISGYNLVIRNSIFSKDVVYDVLVQDFSNPACCGMKFGQPRDVVIENNWFGAPVTGLQDPGGDRTDDRQPDLQFDERFGAWKNFLVRYNSFHNSLDFATAGGTPSFDNVRVVANVGDAPRCFRGAPGLTWGFNAWKAGVCDSSDVRLQTLPYVSSQVGAENFHLRGGRAVNLIKTKTKTKKRKLLAKELALSTDIDGQRRPRGVGRDAGADER